MCNIVLKILHWFIAIMIWGSSLFVSNKQLLFALSLQLFVMLSWLMAKRCILWDIQKKLDPNFSVGTDTSSHIFNMNRKQWLLFTHTMIYLNTLYLGYRTDSMKEIIIITILYLYVNGQFLHKGDDDLSKYSLASLSTASFQ